MATAELVDLVSLCQTFPRIPEHEIWRDSMLETILMAFEDGTNVVLVQGGSGRGKTALLSQFSRKHCDNAISLFVTGATRSASDPWLLRVDLAAQINWILRQEELPDPAGVDDRKLLELLYMLRRHARKAQKRFFFVIDTAGTDETGREHDTCRGLLELINFGTDEFRLVLSGDVGVLPRILRERQLFMPWMLPVFSLDETTKYLEDFSLPADVLNDLHDVCRGVPGHLASVRRLLKGGTEPRDLVREAPSKLLRIEWQAVDMHNAIQANVLSVVAHDRRRHTAESLSRMLKVDPEAILQSIIGLEFVQLDSLTGHISYASETFREYAAGQLQTAGVSASEMVIADLLADPNSDDSLALLPSYFDMAQRHSELVHYLSPSRFQVMLNHRKSLCALRGQINLGMAAARNLSLDSDLIRFAVQGCLTATMSRANALGSELKALMALGDYASATALARCEPILEDRLQLLAALARAYRLRGHPIDPALVADIRQLCDSIDSTSLGMRAFDIASDLLYCTPDLARGMVERAYDAAMHDENELDWALARFAALARHINRESDGLDSSLADFEERIRDPVARQFSRQASAFIADYTASEVIAEAKKMGTVGDQLYLLRLWAKRNRRRSDGLEVLEHALEQAISSTEYSPNAKVIRELAEVLPFYVHEPKARLLIALLDSLSESTKRIGPTDEYVRLQLILARTQARFDRDLAKRRVIETYLDIQEMSDLSARASSMAWLVSTLNMIDPKLEWEEDEGIHTLTACDLQEMVDTLLCCTAEQYSICRPILRALVRTHPQQARRLAERLNTSYRRDAALIELVDAACGMSDSQLDLPFLIGLTDAIVDEDARSEGILYVLQRLADSRTLSDMLIDAALPLLAGIKTIPDSVVRLRAFGLFYLILRRHTSGRYAALAEGVSANMASSWESIDEAWVKNDAGYRICSMLADVAPESAREWIERTNACRVTGTLDECMRPSAYIGCIDLAVRALSGLLRRRLDDPSDLLRLQTLIEQIPSCGERARIWADIAMSYWAEQRHDQYLTIVSHTIKPLVNGIDKTDVGCRRLVITYVAPIMYVAHRLTALDFVQELPGRERDWAYGAICDFILRGRSVSEPYEVVPGQGFDVSYEGLVDVCELMKNIETDYMIDRLVIAATDTMVSPRYKKRFSQEQRLTIAAKLQEVVDSRLPDMDNIQHEGYSVVAAAHICRLRQSSAQDWISIADRARRIPNSADRAFVLSYVAECMPAKERDRRREFFLEAMRIASEIPSDLDRVGRYLRIAESASITDRVMSQECLRTAMRMSGANADPEFYLIQRRIVDMAYRLDSEFAASLASLVDDDPARLSARQNVQEQTNMLTARNQLADEKSRLPSDIHVYSRAAWSSLGAMNAGRMRTVPMERIREVLFAARDLPFLRAYPVLAWAIENAKERFKDTDQAATLLRPMFEALLQAAEFSADVTARSRVQPMRNMRVAVESSDGARLLVQPGMRDDAIKFIRDWVATRTCDYLKIHDPYFAPSDLTALQLIQSANPGCCVHILTSRKRQDQEHVDRPWAEAYSRFWHTQVSDQDPPDADVMIVGLQTTGDTPIHDRWWLTGGSGLDIGTSLNSLGDSKATTITVLSEEDAARLEGEVDQYLNRTKRHSMGERLIYEQFTLE